MKANEISVEVLASHLRLEFKSIDYAELNLLESILKAATAYVREYTGLTPSAMNRYDDLAVAILVVAQDMYDNRAFINDRNYTNVLISSILNLRSVNICPNGGR